MKIPISVESRDEKVKKSLKYSIADGSFYSLMVGFGESFFTAFAIFLKANNIEIGLISSLPQALGSIAQLYSTKLISIFKSRKTPVLINAALEGLMFLPIIFVYFFGNLKVTFLILFLCLYWIFRMLINPAWSSWMGDLVKPGERGKYFGRRNKFTGFFTLIALMVGGYLLAANKQNEYLGFVIVFLIAMSARLISVFFLSLKYEPSYTQVSGSAFSLQEFLGKAVKTNFGLFAFFLTTMNFSVYLSAPFFAAFMLRDLQLDYLTFSIIIAVPLITKFLTTDAWGYACDRFGSRKILTMTALLISSSPLLWLFSTDFKYLILIQMYSGFVWAGFEISTFNFILDCTSTLKRATAISYYNLLNGLAVLAGAIVGGIIVKYNSLFWSKYIFIFLVSGIARFAVAIYFIPKIHEMRHVQKATYTDVLASMFSHSPAPFVQSRPVPMHEDPDRKRKPKKYSEDYFSDKD
ncbi:MAG: MFS transporter [Nanoarchaeota archaeon]